MLHFYLLTLVLSAPVKLQKRAGLGDILAGVEAKLDAAGAGDAADAIANAAAAAGN